MFSRPVFADIAKTGDWLRSTSFLAKHELLVDSGTRTVSDLFESAWCELKKSYRNEYVYKAEVANRVIFGRHSPRTAALHVEMPVGSSIVDLAVFNGTSTAYEIKTEFDSAHRLQTQTRDYLKVFDKVFVVTHPAMAAAYAAVVDERVGVLSLSRTGSLSQFRDAESNSHTIDSKTVFRCLHRAEYVQAVEAATAKKLHYPNGLIGRKCEEIFTQFATKDVHETFVKSLRDRKTDLTTVNFVSQLPACMRVLGYATPLSGRQRATALSVLNEETSLAIV
ncbi:sce7726 family protein [Burkholderia gladioli]|uniref:sce7726 family protein n=1 Tax=Burkholderia gladioli TaxID=28095 RepID=UPI001FC82251|nr:sce7726 family protein [Burkholderia gladioli]